MIKKIIITLACFYLLIGSSLTFAQDALRLRDFWTSYLPSQNNSEKRSPAIRRASRDKRKPNFSQSVQDKKPPQPKAIIRKGRYQLTPSEFVKARFYKVKQGEIAVTDDPNKFLTTSGVDTCIAIMGTTKDGKYGVMGHIDSSMIAEGTAKCFLDKIKQEYGSIEFIILPGMCILANNPNLNQKDIEKIEKIIEEAGHQCAPVTSRINFMDEVQYRKGWKFHYIPERKARSFQKK